MMRARIEMRPERRPSASGARLASPEARPAWARVSEPSDAAELEADRLADRAVGTALSGHDEFGAGIRSGGEMDPATAAAMGSAFGHDFSRVRIHHDAQAGAAARDVRARAFTTGDDVVFGSGEYRPDTASGRRLLAHELAHVVQGERAPGGAAGAALLHRKALDNEPSPLPPGPQPREPGPGRRRCPPSPWDLAREVAILLLEDEHGWPPGSARSKLQGSPSCAGPAGREVCDVKFSGGVTVTVRHNRPHRTASAEMTKPPTSPACTYKWYCDKDTGLVITKQTCIDTNPPF